MGRQPRIIFIPTIVAVLATLVLPSWGEGWRGVFSLEAMVLAAVDDSGYQHERGQMSEWEIKRHLFLQNLDQPGHFALNYNDGLPLLERLQVSWGHNETQLYFGPARFTTSTPNLSLWQSYLSGLHGWTQWGPLQLHAAVGQVLAIPRTQMLIGRGLVGPYLLSAAHMPIIAGSERVKVDGKQLGPIDYTIDYELGAITFRFPVMTGSVIEVAYEYKGGQEGHIAVAAAHWQRHTSDLIFLAGYDATAARQTGFHGLAWEWFPAPDSHLLASLFQQKSQNEVSSANTALTASFGKRMGAWHSKSNLFWQLLPAPNGQRKTQEFRLQHVLTHLFPQGQLAWRLQAGTQPGVEAVLEEITTGVLMKGQWRDWDLQVELGDIPLLSSKSVPGSTLTRYEAKAQLVDHADMDVLLRWQQSRRLPGEQGPLWTQFWQLDAMQFASLSSAWWRGQGFYSKAQMNGMDGLARSALGRWEAEIPVWKPEITLGGFHEFRYRLHDDREEQRFSKTRLQAVYSDEEKMLKAFWLDERNNDEEYAEQGVEWMYPLSYNWRYDGAISAVGGAGVPAAGAAWQYKNGLAYINKELQMRTDWVAGFLPPFVLDPEEEDDEKDADERITTWGQRLSWEGHYEKAPWRMNLRLARDWEQATAAWSGEILGAFEKDRLILEAELRRIFRQGSGDFALQQWRRVSLIWTSEDWGQLQVSAKKEKNVRADEEKEAVLTVGELGWQVEF